ncbi:MAG: type II secretion system F family protein, partial [Chthoniobacterales bacterium]
MPRFTYIALDARGQESTGLVEASTTNEAIGELRRAGYFPTHVYEESAVAAAPAKAARTKKAKAPPTERKARRADIVLFQRKTVRPKILMIFTRQLATLIDAGLPLLRGLNVLAKQERDAVLKGTINKLADSVQGGS